MVKYALSNAKGNNKRYSNLNCPAKEQEWEMTSLNRIVNIDVRDS